MYRLIFGCGYLGKRVAARWHAAGDEVTVVTRSETRARDFRQRGYEAIVADVTRPESLIARLPPADTTLFAVGYDRSGQQTIAEVYAGGIRNVLNGGTINFTYISTTGVYGPSGGNWVDENTPTDPQRDGGHASLAAEEILANHPIPQSVILRLAGIYGPARVPYLSELRAGQPIQVPTSGYLNLIHVDDAASVVLAAATYQTDSPSSWRQPQIYNVSDGHPVSRHDFYREVARLSNSPPPQFVEADPNSPRAVRARDNRRVRNDKMLAELDVKLAYPDYRAGLAAILETGHR
jgi:nucleoside-diphosphate-sugar epimerase